MNEVVLDATLIAVRAPAPYKFDDGRTGTSYKAEFAIANVGSILQRVPEDVHAALQKLPFGTVVRLHMTPDVYRQELRFKLSAIEAVK